MFISLTCIPTCRLTVFGVTSKVIIQIGTKKVSTTLSYKRLNGKVTLLKKQNGFDNTRYRHYRIWLLAISRVKTILTHYLKLMKY